MTTTASAERGNDPVTRKNCGGRAGVVGRERREHRAPGGEHPLGKRPVPGRKEVAVAAPSTPMVGASAAGRLRAFASIPRARPERCSSPAAQVLGEAAG